MLQFTTGADCQWDAAVRAAPGGVLRVAAAPWDGAQVGKCYLNVQEVIRRAGGAAVYGWALTDFGPHQLHGMKLPPLYRRWLNHVVWRDAHGQLWEVSPNAVIDNHDETQFVATEFLPDSEATFEFISEDEWYTRPTRYIPQRPEGALVTELLNRAQLASGNERNHLLGQALAALQLAGFRPREWKVECIGPRTGSIWLIAE
jgi:hypothetical protein